MSKRNSGPKIVIANWKMNPGSLKEAEKWFGSVAGALPRIRKTQVVICPPFLYIERLKKLSRKILLGAQDAFVGDVGPFTSAVSTEMLYNIGARYVILGHSEKRVMGENNNDVNKKIKSALASGLVPIICIGEKERDAHHKYFDVVKNQLKECLAGVSKGSFYKIVIAYEPVWAISSTPGRRDATADDSREMAVFIRKVLSDISTPDIASGVRILYGGSVNDRDAGEFIQNGGVEGFLVGRASLDSVKFSQIVNICEASKS